MDYNKAIKTLGLTSNFTEGELKKTYKKPIAQHHPDRWSNKSEAESKKAEEMTKEINLAKEYQSYLNENKTKRRQSNTYRPNETVELQLKKENFKRILNNMKIELSSIPNIYYNDILNNAKDKIMYIVNTQISQINLIYTLSSFQILESTYYTRISQILDNFEKEYCKKYNIKIENRKLERYSLKKLYIQLEEIKKEQNGFSIEELLDKELNKYVYYSGYITIKNLINNIKNDIIKKNSFIMDTKEKIINKFNKRVLKEFKEYYKRLDTLNKFKQMNLTKPKLKKLLVSLEENIANPETFKYLETKIVNELADLSTPEMVAKTIINNKKEIYNNIEKVDYIKKEYKIKKNIYSKKKTFND